MRSPRRIHLVEIQESKPLVKMLSVSNARRRIARGLDDRQQRRRDGRGIQKHLHRALAH
jgi:hypothetical protein